jgi:CelD/BcsL family acetyltransferase involved in cellulose biosynthesis
VKSSLGTSKSACTESGALAKSSPNLVDCPDVREFSTLDRINGLSDYLDALIAPNQDSRWALALQAWMQEQQCGYSSFEFQHLSGRAHLRVFTPPRGWQRTVSDKHVLPRLALPETPAKLGEVLPRSIVQQAEDLLRRAEKTGPIEFRLTERQSFVTDVDTIFALHSKRWATRQKEGIFGSPRQKSFYHDAWSRLLDLGLLRLFHLSLGNRAIASLCGFSWRKHFYYYIAGFDPEAAKLSPGTLLIWLTLQHVCQEGCRIFDFLRGAEPYKYRWGAKDEPTFTIQLTRGSMA